MPRLRSLSVLLFLVFTSVSQQLDDKGVLSCTSSAECDTEGASCVAGTCHCPAGRIMVGDMTRCLDAANEFGAACEESTQCAHRLLVGGTCDKDTATCRCAEGYHYLEGRCWKTAGLGEACSTSERCYANHDKESVTCSDGKCVCAEGFYQREYSSCRRISTAPGQECGITQDCQYPGSVCTAKRVCACAEGFANQEGKGCVSTGGSAPRSLPPAAGGKSSRKPRAAEAAGVPSLTLAAVSKASQACKSASDCSGTHRDCDEGRCVCQRGYFSADGQTDCLPELLTACSVDKDCPMKYSVCRADSSPRTLSLSSLFRADVSTPTVSWCSCKGGYVPSEDNRVCRKMSRTLGWSCLHDEQCGYFGPGGRCVAKKCGCASGTHFVEEQAFCWVSKALGESCRSSLDCSTGGVDTTECGSEGTCRCVEGHHVTKDKTACRPDIEDIGGECEMDDDCIMGNARCNAGACACSPGYIASGNVCVAGVGGACNSSVECTVAGTSCEKAVCTCPQDFVANTNGDACLQVIGTLSDTCTISAQCADIGASCEEGLCVCGDEQHFRDGHCWQIRKLGDSCSRTSECFVEDDEIEDIVCRNGLCQCHEFGVQGSRCQGSGGRPLRTVLLSLLLPILAAALLH